MIWPRVQFICKKKNDSYGVSFGLLNSGKFVSNYLNECRGTESRIDFAVDGNEIDRLVTEYNPTHVILEALWVTADKLKELFSHKRHQNRVWVVRIHSKASFLANEGMAFDWLWKYADVCRYYPLVIAPNTEELSNDLKHLLKLNTVWLPNIYYPCDESSNKEALENRDGVIDVGCFGAIRPMKNHLTQAIAAMKFADQRKLKLRFHVNGNRVEQKGDAVFKNVQRLFSGQKKHELVPWNWMPHSRFLEVVRSMDLGLQVSFTESFNIVAADFVNEGIPLVGSAEIPYLPSGLHADPNSSESICSVMNTAYGFYGKWLKHRAYRNLKATNDEAKQIWQEFIWKTLGYEDVVIRMASVDEHQQSE